MTETTQKLENNSEFQMSQLGDGEKNIANKSKLSASVIVQSIPNKISCNLYKYSYILNTSMYFYKKTPIFTGE